MFKLQELFFLKFIDNSCSHCHFWTVNQDFLESRFPKCSMSVSVFYTHFRGYWFGGKLHCFVNRNVRKEQRGISSFCFLSVWVPMHIDLENGLAQTTVPGQGVTINYTTIWEILIKYHSAAPFLERPQNSLLQRQIGLWPLSLSHFQISFVLLLQFPA